MHHETTTKGFVVATGFLEALNEEAYTNFWDEFLKQNATVVYFEKGKLHIAFKGGFLFDFSEAQMAGFQAAIYKLAVLQGCTIERNVLGLQVLLYVKGCEFHYYQSVERQRKKMGPEPGRHLMGMARALQTTRDMNTFDAIRSSIVSVYPNLKGWMKWWSNVLHGAMIFPAMRAAVTGETELQFKHLPTTNNQSESINSSKVKLLHARSQLCPGILDSFLYTLKQEKSDAAVRTLPPTSDTHSHVTYRLR